MAPECSKIMSCNDFYFSSNSIEWSQVFDSEISKCFILWRWKRIILIQIVEFIHTWVSQIDPFGIEFDEISKINARFTTLGHCGMTVSWNPRSFYISQCESKRIGPRKWIIEKSKIRTKIEQKPSQLWLLL